MKSRYLYSIFFLLGLTVVSMILISFKYIGNPNSSMLSTIESASMDDTTNMLDTQYIKNSWLGQIKELNQKSYFYAVSEIQLKLN